MTPHPLLYSRQAPDSLQVLQASLRPLPSALAARPVLVVAGATGALGSEVLRRLAGCGGFAHTHVLAHEPMSTGLAQVTIAAVRGEDIAAWPVRPLPVQTGVVMFEPHRLYHDRERALWTPQPAPLPALAQWLRRCGVQTLVLVLPQAPHMQDVVRAWLNTGQLSLAD